MKKALLIFLTLLHCSGEPAFAQSDPRTVITTAAGGITVTTITTTNETITGTLTVSAGSSSTTLTNVALTNGANAVLQFGRPPTCTGGGCAFSGTPTNSAGKVMTTTTGAVSIVVTFSTAFGNAPSCWGSNETSAYFLRAIGGTTSVTLAGTTNNGDTLAFGCLSR